MSMLQQGSILPADWRTFIAYTRWAVPVSTLSVYLPVFAAREITRRSGSQHSRPCCSINGSQGNFSRDIYVLSLRATRPESCVDLWLAQLSLVLAFWRPWVIFAIMPRMEKSLFLLKRMAPFLQTPKRGG